jgi:hypothetical protein
MPEYPPRWVPNRSTEPLRSRYFCVISRQRFLWIDLLLDSHYAVNATL